MSIRPSDLTEVDRPHSGRRVSDRSGYGHSSSDPKAEGYEGRGLRRSSLKRRLVPAGLIPQCKFHAIPKPKLVVDDSQIIFYDVFGRSDFLRDVAVLQALGDKLDDAMFTLAGDAVSVPIVCEHNCLRYNRVASFTRLMPPLIPKRRNRRLK